MAATTLIEIQVTIREGGGRLLAPLGCPTPHLTPLGFNVEGGNWRLTGCSSTGQFAALIEPKDEVTLSYSFTRGQATYPERMFSAHDSRYTRTASALAEEAAGVAEAAGHGNAGLLALVQHTAEKFAYGHPEEKFYDELDHVPQLCSLTTGSCVDINLYLIAALRAAGYDAGYMTGYFFPEEKQGRCNDMHCWIVTRHDGIFQEWDIAHHRKLGLSEIHPGLTPKPGHRVPLAHSMGLTFPEVGLEDTKLIAEPIRLRDGTWESCDLEILCL